MINAIAELGRFEKEQNPGMSAFDIWLEDSYDNGKYDIVFFIVLEKKPGESSWNYKNIDIEENGRRLKKSLIYKRGAPRGTDITPTAKVAKSISGTFRQKILAWFASNSSAEFLNKTQKNYLEAVHEQLSSTQEQIITDLEEKQKLTDCKGIVLSVKLIEDGNEKYIGDIDFISVFITQKSKSAYQYSKTFKKYSLSQNKICAVCKKEQSEVFGFFTSLGFYTVDKPGMVTGGLNQADSWKNYPVCMNCCLDIETGIKFKEQYLDFWFYGFHYYLLPTLIHGEGKTDILEAITEFKKKQEINDKSKQNILNSEDEVLDLLKNFDNHVHFNLLFYNKPNKGVFRILENIEEVLPSRINTLFEAKSHVDNFFMFKLPENKKGKRIYRFNFGILRDFFPREDARGNHDKHFLQITRKIFSGLPVRYNFLLTHIMGAIRHNFVNDESMWYRSLSGFMLLIYLRWLGILTPTKGANDMSLEFYKEFKIQNNDSFDEKVQWFFKNFEDFFTDSALKGIFLTGVLTQFLLAIQKMERNSTPFRSQLKGLKMNQKDITGLLPKIIEKLEQYDANYYRQLEQLIAKYYVLAGHTDSWNLTIDEMNYIFVLGMNLSEYFKIEKEKK